MSASRSVPCERHVATIAYTCPKCGRPAELRRTTRRRGRLVPRTTKTPDAVRRLFIMALTGIVSITWVTTAVYTRTQQQAETVEQRAFICVLIEEYGEDYVGELADCQHRLAYLRLKERR